MQSLPNEILNYIMMKLPIEDLLIFSKIKNLQIQEAYKDNIFWKKRFFQDIAKYLSNRKKDEILSKEQNSLIVWKKYYMNYSESFYFQKSKIWFPPAVAGNIL